MAVARIYYAGPHDEDQAGAGAGVGSSWSATDLTNATEALTPLPDTLYRNVGAAATWTLTDGILGGERYVLSNAHTATGDLTVTGLSFIDGTDTPTSITIQPGEAVTLQRQTGGAHQITAKHPSAVDHGSDSGPFIGTVDGDARLANLADGQAYHFHALFGDVTLTSAQEIANNSNGLSQIQGIVGPYTIPNGTQGFINRQANGTLTVNYVPALTFTDLFVKAQACYVDPGVTSEVDSVAGAPDTDNSVTGFTVVWTNNTGASVDVSQLEVQALRTGTGPSDLDATLNGAASTSGPQVVGAAYAPYLIEFEPQTVADGATATFAFAGTADVQIGSTGGGASPNFAPFNVVARVFATTQDVEYNVFTLIDDAQRAFEAVSPFAEVDITAGIPGTWTECATEYNNPLLEFFRDEFNPSNTVDVLNYVDQHGIGVKLQDINTNNSFMGGIAFDIPDTAFRCLFEVRKEAQNVIFMDLRRESDNNLNRLTINPVLGTVSVTSGSASIVDNGHSWIVDVTYTVLAEAHRFVLSPDFGAGENCNVFYQFEKFYSEDLVDLSRERWEVKALNTAGQGAGDTIFPFQSDKLERTHYSRLVESNGNGTWTITTEEHPVRVILNPNTTGLTGTTDRVSYIKETGAANGTRLPDSTDGIWGGVQEDVYATAVIPRNTTITVEGRSVSSGNSQSLDVGATIEFVEILGSESTVATATEMFTSTNGACVSIGEQYQLNPDGTTHKIPSVAEYNEFINNYQPHYLALSYEAAGGSSVFINVNGVDATYTDLLNASDAGSGRVIFNGGANGNFNRRARVDSPVLQELGDYVEFSGVDVSPFSQQIIALTTDPTDLAHTTSGVYNFRTAAGNNGNVENYSFRDKTNAVIASGSETNAVYRMTRTLAGISFSRNGLELYCTELSGFTDYSDAQPAIVDGDSGVFRLGSKHAALTSIANTNDTTVVTGHDLTQAAGMHLEITFQDDAGTHQWASQRVDVDNLMERFNAGQAIDGSLTVYSTGFVQINVIDPATGELGFVDAVRELSYVSSELFVVATSRDNSVVTASADSGAISSSYTITFPATIEEDPDGWKQANNQDFVVPAGVDGRYLINASITTTGAGSGDDLSADIAHVPLATGVSVSLADDNDSNETAGIRGVSLSATVNLVEGDIIRLPGFANGTQTISRVRLTITELNQTSPQLATLPELTVTNPNEADLNTVLQPNGDGTATFRTLAQETLAQEDTQPEISNGAGSSVGPVETTFTPTITGDYIFNYFGDVVSGTGGISIGTASGLSDLFVAAPATGDADNSRITPTRPSNFTPAIALDADTTYYISQWAGGGGLVNDHTVQAILQGSAAPAVSGSDVDPIADFAATTKVGLQTLGNRPYMLLEDVSATFVSTERAFDSSVTPWVEIEVVRDAAATHGPMLRANSTGGRQAQLRFNLTDGAFSVANSGANTSLPIVRQAVVEEETIKYLVEFTDPVAHTELEISPAAHDAALTPSPAAQGQTGIIGVKLYESDPRPGVSSGDQLIQSGRSTTAGGVVAVNFSEVFDDGNYALTLTAANGSNVSMMYNADTVSGFQAVARDPAGNPIDTSFSWIAVGIKS